MLPILQETDPITDQKIRFCLSQAAVQKRTGSDGRRRYINRERSWLKFNERVLEEAEDPYNPLLERLKFVAIFASNLDEFFMVRVGSLFDEISMEEEIIDAKSGMNAQQQLSMIFNEVCHLSQRLGDAYSEILQELEQYRYYQIDFKTAEPWLLEQMDLYFKAELLPLLSPQIINSRHPFRFLITKKCILAYS